MSKLEIPTFRSFIHHLLLLLPMTPGGKKDADAPGFKISGKVTILPYVGQVYLLGGVISLLPISEAPMLRFLASDLFDQQQQ
jgi:hypothetical protein